MERDCRLRLQVVGVGAWESDNRIQEFAKSIVEFEQKAKPGRHTLAIGFTSQYALTRGRFHLGGIRAPLATHLLVREWSQVISEAERLEVLLHELGHFLGAAHRPDADSVMRPILADRRIAGRLLSDRLRSAEHAGGRHGGRTAHRLAAKTRRKKDSAEKDSVEQSRSGGTTGRPRRADRPTRWEFAGRSPCFVGIDRAGATATATALCGTGPHHAGGFQSGPLFEYRRPQGVDGTAAAIRTVIAAAELAVDERARTAQGRSADGCRRSAHR